MLFLLNITILCYKFQIKFIFILYVIIQVNYGISQDSKTNGGVYFEEKECVNTSCCDDFRLEFTVIKHLPAGVFHGKQVEIITVNDTDVTMDSNVLERICGLEIFDVRESSQEVIYLHFLKLFVFYFRKFIKMSLILFILS